MKAKLTKQGVRDLNVGPQRHVHKYAPVTVTHPKTQRQVTQMTCYCGDVDEESMRENNAIEMRRPTEALRDVYE